MKHTKGWYCPLNDTFDEVKVKPGDSNGVFSEFKTMDGGKGRRLVCRLNPSHEDYEENAKLISAAPDLLEAATEVYRRMLGEENEMLRPILEAAITKATKDTNQ